MVSQGTIVPDYMPDGTDEDSLDELKSRKEVEDYPNLVDREIDILEDSSDLAGQKTRSSALGGILVVVSDVEGSDGEEPLFETVVEAVERHTISRVAKMTFVQNREERVDLIALRAKLQEMQAYMEKHDLFMAMFEKESMMADVKFNFGLQDPTTFIGGRDEFGLPIFTNWTSEKSSNQVLNEILVTGADHSIKGVNVEENVGVSGVKDSQGVSVVDVSNPKTWANILKNDSPPLVKFDYFPLAPSSSVVEPPIEVLKKGIDKFKLCIVGTFTKGAHSFSAVTSFVKSMTDFLARGTWYILQKPMVVTVWGAKPGVNKISFMPLWIKLSSVPECYWTDEGLSRLASVVGRPLGADTLTSKLEMLPLAKMCVSYKIGDPLPNEIMVSAIDPSTEESYTAKVLVSYPIRPLSCNGCHSLGHSVRLKTCLNTTINKPKLCDYVTLHDLVNSITGI
ncbi:hypothetical protein POM88_051744 [Heracleum sosnowskyi]|uniref:DUF4283 domain-containing protein n=1 Tax=Heracleum sosnowskyi TaxID=360622 RepID=A0AAD8M3Z8_9APIA|nr:hypothetical protein POM88_051744 [Heracleum sosnowskyi]